jgi:hypothetical protein
MQTGFNALRDLLKEPIRTDGGVKTDSSVLLVYPPVRELDFREHLLDTFLPQLDAMGHPYRVLDLSGFLFADFDEETIEDLREDEFDDYRWMRQGLASRVEQSLARRVGELAAEVSGGTIIVYATVALYPLIRFGELLRDMRDLGCRIVLAFPGEERGGKLHFMNQPDGGNYLAVKLML